MPASLAFLPTMQFIAGISGQRFKAGDFSENCRAGNRTMMPGLPPAEELTSRSTAKFLSQSHANQIVQQYIRKHKFQEMAEKTQFMLLAEEFLPVWYLMDTSSSQRSGFQKDFWLAAGDSIPVRESAIQEQQYDLPCAHINRSLGCDLLMSPRPGTYDFISDNTYLHGNRWLQLHHHIIFCWAKQGVKLASMECSIIQGAHMAMQHGLVSAPQKRDKVSLKWKPLKQYSDAEQPGQSSTGREVWVDYDTPVV